jgi:SAM-dependent methyltransferase
VGLLLSLSDALSPHGSEAPSPWVRRWSHLLAPHSSVLDVACGQGRHMAWLAGLGHAVCGVDRSAQALAVAGQYGETVQADIEHGPWPLMAGAQVRQFGAVVVTNYLWRALFPTLLASLAPGGVLIYETFTQGNETVGKPSRPAFLLQPGELLRVCQRLRIVAYEDGFVAQPARFVQRIVAVHPTRPDNGDAAPARYALG